MPVKFVTGSNYAEGAAILSPLIQEIIDQTEEQVGLESELTKFGFVRERPLTPSGKITSLLGPEPLQKIGEDETAPIRTQEQGYEKGYLLEPYALQHKVTKLFRKWIEQGAQIEGADSSVKESLNKLRNDIVALVNGGLLTMNELVAKVFGNGFSVTQAYGPGSASPDGVALFSSSHVVKKTGATFSNLAAGALSETNLKAAIQSHKLTLRTGNGYRIKVPNMYTLIVPRALETAARILLNSSGDQAGLWAGTGSNANLMNVFSFEGSRIELVVVDMLGQPDADGNTI